MERREMREINQKNIDKINIKIFKQIEKQLNKDLSPNQLNSIARLALELQKVIVIDDNQGEREKEAFKNIMDLLDQVKIHKLNTP
jgi:uncharacterized tellurite resistance protein B-like protein